MLSVALVGAPCAGKTAVVQTLQRHFKSKGVSTATVPESATFLLQNGGGFHESGIAKSVVDFQVTCLNLQLAQEQVILDMVCRSGIKPSLVLFDSCAATGKVYAQDEDWA